MTASMSILTATNPYDQSIVAEVPYETSQQIEAKLLAAKASQSKWKTLALEDRIRVVLSGLKQMEQAKDTITADVSRQMGKPLTQSVNEFTTLFERAHQIISDSYSALAADELPNQGFTRRIEHEPLGVVLDIAAWNYPLVIPVNVIIPALLAGNTVLLKHSAKTPLTGIAFEEAFGNLEIPNLVANLTLSHQQTAKLIGNRLIDHVSFTGSVEGGQRIYQTVAATRLIDVGLELGGKDPAYVAADADLEAAATSLVDGACYNAGQSCCGIERIYVHEDVYEEFLELAKHAITAYQLGDPLDPATTMGPLASSSAPAFLQQQVDDALNQGARLIFSGQIPKHTKGNFYAPALLADVNNIASVMQEESFGPLLPVSSVRSDTEALERMNDSVFGLTASIWTNDRERAEAMSHQLNAGTIFQNRCDFLDPALPWTGWGDSGKGSTLSRFGFYHLTRCKSIHFRNES